MKGNLITSYVKLEDPLDIYFFMFYVRVHDIHSEPKSHKFSF